jgi:hypothetical protein
MPGKIKPLAGRRRSSANNFMANIMTPETMRKIKETRDAQNAAFESQTITIDNHWRIIRSDILNWEVQFKGQFWGYFGTVAKAFQALPGKMLSEEARGGVADVRSALNDIMERIEKAMK